jgi:hypothetical protein
VNLPWPGKGRTQAEPLPRDSRPLAKDVPLAPGYDRVVVVRVVINQPRLLPELADRFRQNDCIVFGLSESSLDVLHQAAHDDHEAREEVAFFVRAWQLAHPGVDVDLYPTATPPQFG